jgi:hypothetical protein
MAKKAHRPTSPALKPDEAALDAVRDALYAS